MAYKRDVVENHLEMQKSLAFVVLSFLIVSTAQDSFSQETNANVLKSPYVGRDADTEPLIKPVENKDKKVSTEKLEQYMFELVNKDRAKSGAPPVKLSKELTALARELASDLMRRKAFEHKTGDGLSTNQRAVKKGIRTPIFENLGTQSGPDPALQMVTELEESFVSEPPDQQNHRFILLNPKATHVGIAIIQADNSIIVVQNFTESDPAANDTAGNGSETP